MNTYKIRLIYNSNQVQYSFFLLNYYLKILVSINTIAKNRLIIYIVWKIGIYFKIQ
mgnify:CR=1 FL=1